MYLEVTKAEFDTILGALRYYQRKGMGNPDRRPDWLQDIVAPTIDDTSLCGSDIGQLCERLNTEDPAVPAQLLAALERAVADCDARNDGREADYDWVGEAEQAIAAAKAAGLVAA